MNPTQNGHVSRGASRAVLIAAIALIAIVVVVVLLRKPSATTAPSAGPTAEHVVINQAAKTLLYLPLYIANDKGFFRDEKIDASIITGGGDSQAFAAISGGSADFGQGDPMMVPISRQRGGSGKIIANVVAKVAFWGVAIDPKIVPIRQPQDFAGKKVVTYPEPMTIYALQKRNLLQAGLTPGKDSTIVQAQFGAELAPLFAKDADITMTIEPVVSQALSKGAKIVYSFPEKYGDFALTGVMATDATIAKRADVVQRVINAYQHALVFAHSNPDGAIEVARKEFPDVDQAIVADAVRRMLSEETIPKTVVVTQKAYEQAMQVRREVGDLEKPISFADAVDNTFAENAVRKFPAR